MEKKRKHTKNCKISKKIILVIIIILCLLTVFYPAYKSLIPFKSVSNHAPQVREADILIYPGSTEKLFTQTGNRMTINYKTAPYVDYRSVIAFYKNNMGQFNWKLESSSETDAVFTKDLRKVRVWILYAETSENNGVDYIIDYTLTTDSQPLSI